MVPYYFWGTYNIMEMNSSTNVTRSRTVDDDKISPARVFTANNTPAFVNSFEGLPMPTEDFVRNFGRRMHHIAIAVQDGHVVDEKNVDYVVRQLSEMGTPFLADVVGECKDDPNLKQIFSKSSPFSLLITEYVERCPATRASSPATTSPPSPRPPAKTSATTTATSSTDPHPQPAFGWATWLRRCPCGGWP